MKVILLQSVKNLGNKNEVVNVSDGYFRNYLFPKKLAVAYTAVGKQHLESDLNILKIKEEELIASANVLKDKIDSINLLFSLKVVNSKVFGSISTKQIIEQLKSKNILLTKYVFDSGFEPLKIGFYIIKIKLHNVVYANLKIQVEEI